MRTYSILYDRALTRANAFADAESKARAAKILLKRELLIVEPSVYHELEEHFAEFMPELKPRCRLYFNPWGLSSHRTVTHPWPAWQPGPGDIGQPDYVTSRGVHMYRMSDAHLRWFLLEALWPAVRGEREGVGVILDDMDYSRPHWNVDPAVADIVWAPRDGKPGWRSGPTWNRSRIELAEDMALAMCAEGLEGVVVNGCARRRGLRLFEAFGQWVTPQQLRDQAKPGDLIQVNGILPDREGWATVDDDGARYGGFPLGTSFEVVYAKACELADELGLRVGLAYRWNDHSIYTSIGHVAEGVL